MFCEGDENKDMEMPCALKAIYEIISFISLICSIFVVYVTAKNIKMNILHKLILQNIISEIIEEINILLGIISDSRGSLHFENYDFRMYVCFTQIYLSVFSCLWTLTASLFISIKLYYIIINKNRIFKDNNFLSKHIMLISIAVPIIISYFFWIPQVIIRTDFITLNSIYVNKISNGTQMIKLVFCWVNQELSIALACLVFLLIFGNLYFSIFRGYFFLKKMKDTILDQDDDYNIANNNKIRSIKQIQKILFLYPIIASIIWIIFFLFIFIFNFSYREHQSTGWSVVFCIFMAIRQSIYTLVYFLSQKKLRYHAYLYITCKKCKKNKNRGSIQNPVKQIEIANVNQN